MPSEAVGLHRTWVRGRGPGAAGGPRHRGGVGATGGTTALGKVFEMDAAAIAEVFPRLRNFAELRDRVDPERVFGNAFLGRVLGRG